ncbi:putative flavin dependent monooxygenase [Aspergillus stella-maris]|uniref:putative flavin dependent monooxygenase n=1 Tax=Aspergillus stella-maris TaxID=1810926 RepID=UPI003CCD6A69
MALSKQIRRIAVIGAGPAGLASVKYLLAEKCFDTIDVFERRSAMGGVWNYSPGALKQAIPTPVPQLSPNEPLEEPKWLPKDTSKDSQEPTFVSPIYDTLDTNLPKELMAFGDQEFPAAVQDFPRHSTVKDYVRDYGEVVKNHIEFETQVLDVKKESKESDWTVTTRSLRSGTTTTGSYDAVVAASGHFDVPYLPDIPGVVSWNEAYPGIVTHSKFYDSPEPFKDKKVIVIGSSASGLDIGNQINEVSKGKVLASQRTDLYLSPSTATDKAYYPEIVEFLSPSTHERAVRFADGRVEQDIDAIVFCTGFFYSFPFLSSINPPLITHGRRVENIYQHLFYIHDPTLVLPVLPQRIIPFPLSENQAAVFSRVWSGRLSLPSTAEMESWESSLVAEKGDGPAFHLMPYPLDAVYMNMLHDWASTAEPQSDLDRDGKGKQSNYWTRKEKWMREMVPEMRKAFFSRGEERHSIKTLEELGYRYEQWQSEHDHQP